MYEFFFSVPWWAPTILVIAGLAVMTRGNRRQNRQTRDIGAGVILLGVGWAVISFLVDTPKEICTKQTRAFVQSVVAKDWKTFDDLIDSNVRFEFADEHWDIQGRDELDTKVHVEIDQVGVSSASVAGLEASEKNDVVTTTFRVFSVQKATMDQPITSDWDFDWHKSSAGHWVVSEIRCRGVGNMDAKSIQGSLPVK
jgi:hypothetical protein